MNLFKQKYDAIIIGASMAGLATAIQLGMSGKKAIILEQNNTPGGLATSFVRNGFEFDATTQEILSVGPEQQPLAIRKFFDDAGVKLNWIMTPEAYCVVMPKLGLNYVMPVGFNQVAEMLESKFPGSDIKEDILDLLNFSKSVYDSVYEISENPNLDKKTFAKQHANYIKCAGHTVADVFEKLKLPEKVQELLTPYFIQVGTDFKKMPFSVWAVLTVDHFLGGGYVPKGSSHAMGLAMEKRAKQMGVQIEYLTKVEKILVEKNRVKGVVTSRGDTINSDYVVSGVYPNIVYTKMIEPLTAVPKDAYRLLNTRKLGLSVFNVMLALDKSPEELSLKNYCYYVGNTLDTEKIIKSSLDLEASDFMKVVCLNNADKDCSKPGTTILSITSYPHARAWVNVDADNYLETKREIASKMIDKVSDYLGINFKDYIIEIEIGTPVTMAHYSSSFNGTVMGYEHTIDDPCYLRITREKEEKFFEGLEFVGASGVNGNGLSNCIISGRKAARAILESMRERGVL